MRRHVAWILEIAGVEEAAEFLLRRQELGLIDNDGLHRDGVPETVMRSMINCLQQEMQRDIAEFRERLLDSVKPVAKKLPPKGKHVVVSQEWEDQKQRIIERDNQRRQEQAANRQRVRAAPKPAPIQLHRRRLERSLDATPMEPATATPPKTYSRKPKGECGERIGRKIDALVAEIQASPTPAEIEHQRTCVSACCGPTVVDPPVSVVVTPGGSDDDQGAPSSAADGGISGFPNDPAPSSPATPSATVWDAFSGRAECVNEISDFLQMLDDEPRLRSSAMLRTLGRVREELEGLPEQSALDSQVCIRLQDALVLMTQLMQRLR